MNFRFAHFCVHYSVFTNSLLPSTRLTAAQAAGVENEAAAIRRAETRINLASMAKGLR